MPVAKLTATLPDDLLRQVDRTRAGPRRRSEFTRDALRQYLGPTAPGDDEATPEKAGALERGRAQIARGESVTLERALDDLGLDPRTGPRRTARPPAAP